MKKLLLMTLALMVCAGAAMADHIGLYTDAAGSSCALTALVAPPASNNVFVVHKFNGNGSSASQFKVNDLSTLFPTSQVYNYLAIGTWNTDLSLAYGGCVIGDHSLATLSFLWFGVPIAGCGATLSVVPAATSPIADQIATVECDFQTLTPSSGGTMYVGQAAAGCIGTGGCDPIGTSQTTWGQIKSLYR